MTKARHMFVWNNSLFHQWDFLYILLFVATDIGLHCVQRLSKNGVNWGENIQCFLKESWRYRKSFEVSSVKVISQIWSTQMDKSVHWTIFFSTIQKFQNVLTFLYWNPVKSWKTYHSLIWLILFWGCLGEPFALGIHLNVHTVVVNLPNISSLSWTTLSIYRTYKY